jgi:hypothetical protein
VTALRNLALAACRDMLKVLASFSETLSRYRKQASTVRAWFYQFSFATQT